MVKKLLRIIYLIYGIFIGAPLFAIVTVVCSVVSIVGCRLGFCSWAAYYPGLVWSRVGLWLSFCPVTIEGKEHLKERGGAYVVVANHQSMYDIFVMYGYIGIPFRWVMKSELRRLWFIGKTCEDAGFIFVDETKRSSITNTIEQGKAVLADGNSIFIFPEGSRTFTGRMTKFKKGAFVMASALDCPILPVSIDGAYDVLVRGKRLPHPHRIRLTIHAPFCVSELGESPKNVVEATRKAQEIIATVLPREQEVAV